MAGQNWKIAYMAARRDKSPDEPTRGVTQEQYAAWCEAHGSPAGDVKLVNDATIEQIYFAECWQPWGQQLPSGIDVLYLDASIVSGPVHAIVKLQDALGMPESGYLGLVTLAAVMRADRKQLIGKYAASLITEHPERTPKIVELQGIALGLV